MGRKVCLRCKGITLLGIVNKLLKTKICWHTQECFTLLPQVNFYALNLNFHWRWMWWDRIQAIFLNLFYFTNHLDFFHLKISIYLYTFLLHINIFETSCILKLCLIFDGLTQSLFTKTQISTEQVDIWRNLILNPSLENLTTNLTIVSSNG